MRYCKKCVQPDTRPGIKFDSDGICPPCRFTAKFDEIDWGLRKQELLEIANFGKTHNVSGYDCIVGVSGGKDSTRQSLYVRDELGLKPLLVCCGYPPEQLTERGAHNISNLISLGFDTITIAPAPQIWKKLMRRSFLKYGNWAKSTEMALYASAPKVAIAYQIPLIFLGENPAIQLGDLGVGSISADAGRMKYSNTLAGGNPDDLLEDENIARQQALWYRYSSDEELEWGKLKIQYLGYYWRDFNKLENAKFSIARGLEIRDDSPGNTGHIFPFNALDDDFVIVNQMIKCIKYGFGQVTDEVCEEIRFGRMTREEAVGLVKKYDGKCSPIYIEKFCDYIGIPQKKFWQVVESFRNKDIWEKDKKGKWILRTSLI